MHLVQDIKQLVSSHNACITHVPRSCNKASDKLASFVRTRGRTMTWLGSGPHEVLEVARDDCNDTLIE